MANPKPTQKDIFLLNQMPDLASKFDEVYGNGAAALVLSTQAPKRAPQTQQQGSYTGAAIRGMTPPLVGAAMGLPFGPVGMLAGSLAVPAGDALTSLINTATIGAEKVTGNQYGRLTPPSQAMQDLLTRAGVPQAETTGQRALQTAMSALGGTSSQMAGLQKLGQTALSPVTREVTKQMAQRPVAQIVSSVPAGAAGQVAAEAAQPLGPIPAILASIGASTVVGGAGMNQRGGGKALTPAETRAAGIAEKAKQLGFTGETALTPAQAGTSRTAQIFEAAGSTLPFSAGQFTKRYGAQSDYAQGIINKVADIFGGMPAQPDTAFSSGASAVKSAAQRNVEKIGSGIREVASQTDIDLAQVPKFQESILNARKILSSIPPALRKDPLFESFEQFYFGKPNEELKLMVDSALKQAGLDPTKPNYKTMEAGFRKQLVDSGIPEFEYLGYQQKGSIAGNDYQDQRQLFGDLAYNNKGTKVGEAFKTLRNSLDDARDETFKAAGMEDQITKLKELRGSYGEAKDLNDRLKTAGDKTAVNYVISNQDQLANKVLPLMNEAEKRSLSQAILADIQQSSMFPTGEMDITKFGRNLIKDVKASPTTLPQILGRENAQTLTDLADVAQSALKAKVPTSGTAERSGMMGLLTSMPAKFGASVVGGTALTGEPVIGPMISLGVPPLAAKAYLSPTMQSIYGNTLDPLFNYFSGPVNPMLNYMGGTGLINTQTTPINQNVIDELQRRAMEEGARRAGYSTGAGMVLPSLLD
jgi:hypothetical protein